MEGDLLVPTCRWVGSKHADPIMCAVETSSLLRECQRPTGPWSWPRTPAVSSWPETAGCLPNSGPNVRRAGVSRATPTRARTSPSASSRLSLGPRSPGQPRAAPENGELVGAVQAHHLHVCREARSAGHPARPGPEGSARPPHRGVCYRGDLLPMQMAADSRGSAWQRVSRLWWGLDSSSPLGRCSGGEVTQGSPLALESTLPEGSPAPQRCVSSGKSPNPSVLLSPGLPHEDRPRAVGKDYSRSCTF